MILDCCSTLVYEVVRVLVEVVSLLFYKLGVALLQHQEFPFNSLVSLALDVNGRFMGSVELKIESYPSLYQDAWHVELGIHSFILSCTYSCQFVFHVLCLFGQVVRLRLKARGRWRSSNFENLNLLSCQWILIYCIVLLGDIVVT